MALPRFFDRVYAAAGGVLSLSLESLEQQVGLVVVGIRLDPEWAADRNATNIADLVVNLCSRLYGTLVLDGPASWCSTTAELARSINPLVTLSSERPTLQIVVGNSRWDERAIYVRSDGWVARVMAEPMDTPPGPSNPIGAAAAASLAVAELFRRAFGAHVPALPFHDVSVSFLDFSHDGGAGEALDHVSIGDVGLVGTGAVGNAALWCLARFASVQGRLALIDDQTIDVSNLQRYVLALDRDVGAVKVEHAAEILHGIGVEVHPVATRFEEAAEDRVAPTLVVSVDNVESRRAVQAVLPRLAINGWTSERGLGASWHELGTQGPCLACGYHPTGQSKSQYERIAEALGMAPERVGTFWILAQPLTAPDLAGIAAHLRIDLAALQPWLGKRIQELYADVVCGAVALDLSGVGRLEAVPLAHQSALAGVLMVSELIKRVNPTLRARAQSAPLVVWDDVLHPAPRMWTQRRAPRRGCICGDPVYQRHYARKWSGD